MQCTEHLLRINITVCVGRTQSRALTADGSGDGSLVAVETQNGRTRALARPCESKRASSRRGPMSRHLQYPTTARAIRRAPCATVLARVPGCCVFEGPLAWRRKSDHRPDGHTRKLSPRAPKKKLAQSLDGVAARRSQMRRTRTCLYLQQCLAVRSLNGVGGGGFGHQWSGCSVRIRLEGFLGGGAGYPLPWGRSGVERHPGPGCGVLPLGCHGCLVSQFHGLVVRPSIVHPSLATC